MNASQLLEQFDRISEAPDAVQSIRAFVLDLAVRGKLVGQSSSEEPASQLLKRIRKERFTRVPQSRPVTPVGREEIPFEVPPNWEWTRLLELLVKLTDGTHHSPPNGPEGAFRYITAKNIKTDGVLLANVSYVTAEVHREIYARCNPEKGDILYIKDGATTGVATINDLDEPFSMLSSVALLKLTSGVYNRLLLCFLRSPFFYSQMRELMKGAAITRVTLKRMSPALVPLPPLAEQHRIVARVDEVMALCDQLESAQRNRATLLANLLESTLHRLLADSS